MSQETFEAEIAAQRGKGGRTHLTMDGVCRVCTVDGVTEHPLLIPHPWLFHAIHAEQVVEPEPTPDDARCECRHRLRDHQRGSRLFKGCLLAGCGCNQYKEKPDAEAK